MSPFGSSTNLTPASQLAQMKLASYSNINLLQFLRYLAQIWNIDYAVVLISLGMGSLFSPEFCGALLCKLYEQLKYFANMELGTTENEESQPVAPMSVQPTRKMKASSWVRKNFKFNTGVVVAGPEIILIVKVKFVYHSQFRNCTSLVHWRGFTKF
ncbi:hypothetical protein NQ317_014714 [Molorchus minor]|uniref:Uncharacterized protein n=1 Tax=Molorchus minor TaxID=1323400 RepID=A0ABQ9JZU9_9CUCU|nr:hypothetical protein NQ317_014714 [Molorchus minor]